MIPCYSYNRPFEGSHEADVALGENEFDTPGLMGVWCVCVSVCACVCLTKQKE